MTRSRWRRGLDAIAIQLNNLRERIDTLGDEATTITKDDRSDQLACYASNSIEGTLALLRDLERHVVPAKARRAK